MAFTTGVFPVHENKFEIKVGEEYKEIADLEGFSITFDGTVEEWYSMENGGWASALKTGMKWSISLKGKRTVGDDRNDAIAGKKFASSLKGGFGALLGFIFGVALKLAYCATCAGWCIASVVGKG